MAAHCHVIRFVLFTSIALGGGKACKKQVYFIMCPCLSCPVNKVGRLFILWGKICNLAITLVHFAYESMFFGLQLYAMEFV